MVRKIICSYHERLLSARDEWTLCKEWNRLHTRKEKKKRHRVTTNKREKSRGCPLSKLNLHKKITQNKIILKAKNTPPFPHLHHLSHGPSLMFADKPARILMDNIVYKFLQLQWFGLTTTEFDVDRFRSSSLPGVLSCTHYFFRNDTKTKCLLLTECVIYDAKLKQKLIKN